MRIERYGLYFQWYSIVPIFYCRIKQAEEERRIVAMEMAKRNEDHAKRVAEEKELHMLEVWSL